MSRARETDWNELVKLFSSVSDQSLMEKMLHALLTQKEREEITLRWMLVKQLKEGHSQRTIASNLGLSLCKITRGSRELKQENSVFWKLFDLMGEIDGQGKG